MAHLLSVAALVLEHGCGEDAAIAAILHDAPEDQGGERVLAEIQDRFGPRVAELVAGASDTMDHPKPAWRPRKEAFIRRLSEADAALRLVVMADKLHNILSILRDYRTYGDDVWDRFQEGRDGSLWYHRAVVEALRSDASAQALFQELEEALVALERLGANQEPQESGMAWHLGYP